MPDMKEVVFHADDFGWSPGINEGIVDSHRHGILTSTSVIATMPGLKDAVRRMAETPSLGCGAHLSINLGRPVSAPESVNLLLDRNGCFQYSYFYHLRNSRNKRYLDQVRREISAQLVKLEDLGFRLDHANSQSHTHMIPPIRDLFEEVLQEFSIRHLRCSVEPWYGRPRIRDPLNFVKCLTLETLDTFGSTPPGMVQFIGIRHSGLMDTQTLVDYLRHLKSGTWEIASHPGTGELDDDSLYPQSAARHMRSANRRLEWEALVSNEVRTALDEAEINPIRFSDIN